LEGSSADSRWAAYCSSFRESVETLAQTLLPESRFALS
jgi:hypothetical protein